MAKGSDDEARLLAAALAAVLLVSEQGEAMGPTGQRKSGDPWSRDHRRFPDWEEELVPRTHAKETPR
ncbi:MAG: hypothetical protein Ct9H300mP10_09520 [Methanobacteriota archaeon]|nr:MAG: hypothetical protein Ct9H300mP10_09520 [Euryarchaeota archaeon]